MKRAPRSRSVRADDWLLTYADAITLLLCLFMAMFATSLTRARHPGAPPHAVCAMPPLPTPTPAPFGTGLPTPVDDAPDDDPPDAAAPVRLLVAAAPRPLPPALAASVAAAGGAIERHGERLTTIRMASEAFFASGSAALSSRGRDILAGVAAQIAQPRFSPYTVTVEGHTDDTPIATASFPSNWELSAARAACVVRFFAGHGVAPSRLRAAGFADSVPVASNRDEAGRAANRRVVIRLERLG